MARPVDEARRARRRAEILGATYELVAQHGYAGTSTSAICRRAGVSSGTFFHYFPTKRDALLAVLEKESITDADDGAEAAGHVALTEWLDDIVQEANDPHLPGFVAALAALQDDAEVAAAITGQAQAQRRRLARIVRRGQDAGRIRTDLTDSEIASWLGILSDGIFTRRVEDATFALRREDLDDVVGRIVAP